MIFVVDVAESVENRPRERFGERDSEKDHCKLREEEKKKTNLSRPAKLARRMWFLTPTQAERRCGIRVLDKGQRLLMFNVVDERSKHGDADGGVVARCLLLVVRRSSFVVRPGL